MPDDMEFSQEQLNALFGDQPFDNDTSMLEPALSDDAPFDDNGPMTQEAASVARQAAAAAPVPRLAGVGATPPAAPPAAPPPQVNSAAFVPLTPNGGGGETSGIDLLLDVALQVSVELGRTRMTIGDVLALRAGSVIELDKLAGEPADILVNGTLIARGEVVVVDEKFGVRVMEVVSRAKRLASLA
jgi:flagellar motor switch protein FliN